MRNTNEQFKKITVLKSLHHLCKMMNMGYETMAMSVEVGQEKNLEGSIYHLYVNQA